jgi:hypothetical protein
MTSRPCSKRPGSYPTEGGEEAAVRPFPRIEINRGDINRDSRGSLRIGLAKLPVQLRALAAVLEIPAALTLDAASDRLGFLGSCPHRRLRAAATRFARSHAASTDEKPFQKQADATNREPGRRPISDRRSSAATSGSPAPTIGPGTGVDALSPDEFDGLTVEQFNKMQELSGYGDAARPNLT